MLKTIEIVGYKSIERTKLDLGRINVFIGENGAGKSNILEAVALAAAAEARKLDNEFLVARGIRVVESARMRPLFKTALPQSEIRIFVEDLNDNRIEYTLQNDNMPYSSWKCNQSFGRLLLDEIDMPIISTKIIEKFGEKTRAIDAMRSFAELLTSAIQHIDKNEKSQLLRNRMLGLKVIWQQWERYCLPNLDLTMNRTAL